VVKFPDKSRHQLFLEPEGLDTHEIYVNGMSTSMPIDVQSKVLASIPGLENAEMIRPAMQLSTMPSTLGNSVLRWKLSQYRVSSLPARLTAPRAMRKRPRRG